MTFIRKILKHSFKLFFYQKSRKIVDWHLYEDINCSSLMIAEFASYNYFRFSILKMSDHNFKKNIKIKSIFQIYSTSECPKSFTACLVFAQLQITLHTSAQLCRTVHICTQLWIALMSLQNLSRLSITFWNLKWPFKIYEELLGQFRTSQDLE